MSDKHVLTTGDIAKYCGVNFRTVIRWIERGQLDAYKLPGRGDNRVPVDSFVTFLNENNMPIPSGLLTGERKLVLLSNRDDTVADIATTARRCHWDLVVANDAVHFGYLVARIQPAAVAVMNIVDQKSAERVIHDNHHRNILPLLLSTDRGGNNTLAHWHECAWPGDQAQFLMLLRDAAEAIH